MNNVISIAKIVCVSSPNYMPKSEEKHPTSFVIENQAAKAIRFITE